MISAITLFVTLKVKHNTDGILSDRQRKLDDKSAAVLDLTGKASASQAVVDEKNDVRVRAKQ